MRALAIVALIAGVAHADLGKPQPSPDLPDGTLVVRVLLGQSGVGVIGINVTVRVGDKPRTAMTDREGRATFAAVPVGAKIVASFMLDGATVTSDTFAMPRGGVRVSLEAHDGRPTGAAAPSGPTTRDPRGSPSALVVHAAAKLPITLVGYAADQRVTVATRTTDGGGSVTFDQLDPSGATAYFAIALDGRERRSAGPVVMPETGGIVLTLASDALAELDAQVAVPAGKVRVAFQGAATPEHVDLIDAATGKVVAKAEVVAGATSVELASASGPLYAVARSQNRTFRSLPFLAAAGRGTHVTIFVLPQVMLGFAAHGEASGSAVSFVAQMSVANNSWIPALATEVPLPQGFADPLVRDADRATVSIGKLGLRLARPLAPGGVRFAVAFDLHASANGNVRWILDLPLGSYDSSLDLAMDPGMKLDVAGHATRTEARDDGDHAVVDHITIVPKQSIVAIVTLPHATAEELAIGKACDPLGPDRTRLRGAAMPAIAGLALGGKPAIVHFMASWDDLSPKELPTFADLATAVPDLVVAMIASDTDKAAVAKVAGTRYPVVMDTPPTGSNIGAIATRWGVKALPESFVVDRRGVVRAYFANARDWSKPDAIGCVKAIAR